MKIDFTHHFDRISDFINQTGNFIGFRFVRDGIKYDRLVKAIWFSTSQESPKAQSNEYSEIGSYNDKNMVFVISADSVDVTPQSGDYVLMLKRTNVNGKEKFRVISLYEINLVEPITVDNEIYFYKLYTNYQEVAPLAEQ